MANDPCGTYTWGETEDYLLKMDCPTSLTITQTQGSGTDASFSASANIIASNRIQTGAVATYSAGTSVLLQPGFVSETGSVFTAKTGGCPN
jgi:hypothetical protein